MCDVSGCWADKVRKGCRERWGLGFKEGALSLDLRALSSLGQKGASSWVASGGETVEPRGALGGTHGKTRTGPSSWFVLPHFFLVVPGHKDPVHPFIAFSSFQKNDGYLSAAPGTHAWVNLLSAPLSSQCTRMPL